MGRQDYSDTTPQLKLTARTWRALEHVCLLFFLHAILILLSQSTVESHICFCKVTVGSLLWSPEWPEIKLDLTERYLLSNHGLWWSTWLGKLSIKPLEFNGSTPLWARAKWREALSPVESLSFFARQPRGATLGFPSDLLRCPFDISVEALLFFHSLPTLNPSADPKILASRWILSPTLSLPPPPQHPDKDATPP